MDNGTWFGAILHDMLDETFLEDRGSSSQWVVDNAIMVDDMQVGHA